MVSHFILLSLVLQIVNFTAFLLVQSFHNTSGWKRLSLPFHMNIDKDLLDDGMDLNDDVLYNCTDATSQLMRDDGVTPWRDHEKNIHCSFKF